MNSTPWRIGLFGGAFDPPHDAHLALARAAIDELGLDVLHVVPTGDAWHKSRPLSPAADRLAMCRLAFAGVPGTLVDDRELQRAGPTYTIDTLSELQAQHPTAELWLLIGADQAAFFRHWRRAPDIVALAFVAVATRAGLAPDESGFDPRDPLPGLDLGAARGVRVLRLPALPHSATEVRARAARGLAIGHLVPSAVAGYIAEHHLYTTT